MRYLHVLLLAGLTLLSVFLLSAAYAFVLQDLVAWLPTGTFEGRAVSERWSIVLTATSVAAVALIIPILVARRIISGRRPTEELAAIVARVEDAAEKGEVRGLILISGKKNNFIAGADIREFDHMESDKVVEDAVLATIGLFDRIEKLRVPVVAAKSNFGNLGAGSSVVELIASILARREDKLFPTLNYEFPDPDCPLNVVTDGDTPTGNSFLNLNVTPQGQAGVLGNVEVRTGGPRRGDRRSR